MELTLSLYWYKMRKFILAFQLFVVMLCSAWLWKHVHWDAVWDTCNSVSIAMLCFVFVQRFMPWILVGFRLTHIFPQEINMRKGFCAASLCTGVNALIPARMGELVKIFWLKGCSSYSYTTVISGCFMERLLDLSCLFLLLLCFAMDFLQWGIVVFLTLAIIMAWLCCYALLNHREQLQNIFPILKKTFVCHTVHKLEDAFAHITSIPVLAKLVVCTLGIWLLNYLHIVLISHGLIGLDLSWLEMGVLLVSIYFSSALMLVPGGIGIMEATVVGVLQLMDVSLENAALLAIFVRVYHFIPSVLLGGIALLQSGESYTYYRNVLKNSRIMNPFKSDEIQENLKAYKL